MSATQGGTATTILPAPAGYMVNLENPPGNLDVETYWVFGVGNFLAMMFLVQRLYTKVFLSRGLQMDDAFLMTSWMTGMATQVLILYMHISKVGGVHGWEMQVEEINVFKTVLYIAALCYVPCGSCAKLSLLIFYLRLSPQRWFQRCVWVTMVFIAAYSLAIFFSLMFSCNPMRKSWDVTVSGGSCIDTATLYVVTAVANIVTDLILFALPIPMVLGLQMPMVQKMGVLAIFTIASATVVTSIVRCVLLPGIFSSTDQTWAIAPASMWIVIEANLMIICGCVPTLRRFFRHLAPKFMGESRYRSQSEAKPPAVAARKRPYTAFPRPSSRPRRGARPRSNFTCPGCGFCNNAEMDPMRTICSVSSLYQPTEAGGGVAGARESSYAGVVAGTAAARAFTAGSRSGRDAGAQSPSRAGDYIAAISTGDDLAASSWYERDGVEHGDSQSVIVQTTTVTVNYV